MNKNKIWAIGILALTLASCKTTSPLPFPTPIDTSDKPISLQEKKTYKIDGISASNEFQGARLNDFEKINDSTYRVTILPENKPINPSPHYAFSIKSDSERKIDLEIFYDDYDHRYWPKIGYGNDRYERIDSSLVDTLKGGNLLNIHLELDDRNTYIVSQELRTSAHNKRWIKELQDKHPHIRQASIGQSKLGRDIYFMDLGEGDTKSKPAIVILSRTHPPEVSGYRAMIAFIEEILRDSPLSNNFRKKFRIMAYPMINPDGVDLGHWRHNAGGIDLNRDWMDYKQPETRAVATHCIEETKKQKNKILVGLDFHSTQEDVLYTHTSNRESHVTPFKDIWIQALEDDPRDLNPNEEAYDLNKPISKGWFYLQFGAEGITYEVGDETDRDFLKYKAEVAAREMMKLLVLKY